MHVPLTKRLLQAQKETGEKILSDVAEGDAQHQTNQACTAHQRERELRKPRNAQHKVKANKHYQYSACPGRYFAQKLATGSVQKPATQSVSRQPGEDPGNNEDDYCHYDQRQKLNQSASQIIQFLMGWVEIPNLGGGHLDLIEYGNHAFRIPRQITRPLPGLIIFRRSIESDDPFLDRDPGLAKPTSCLQNIRYSLPDLVIRGNRVDIDSIRSIGIVVRRARRHRLILTAVWRLLSSNRGR
ncbi:hypothetical protein GCM10011362_26630 [Marinobacter halophilus]|nr:hypothetical protein GCM10011362_26630 [Marinobacter halophilus]